MSQARLLLAPLLEAQYYAVQIQDRDLFKARLQHILEASETLFPEQALLNAVAKQRAALLLQRIDDLEDIFIRRDARDDDVASSSDFAEILLGAHADVARNLLRLRVRPIPNDIQQGVLVEIARHAEAHGAKPDEPDRQAH